MKKYRVSLDATMAWDVICEDHETEDDALAKAKLYVENSQPESIAIYDGLNTCLYPGNANENLRVESGPFPVSPGISDAEALLTTIKQRAADVVTTFRRQGKQQRRQRFVIGLLVGIILALLLRYITDW